MEWYQVTKTIRGRRYHYWQKTYREGGSVKTLNRYIGPEGAPRIAPAYETRVDPGISLQKIREAELLEELQRDALSSHPGKSLAERFRLARYRTGNSLDQLNASAMGKGTASSKLDSIITEHGFDSFDQAEKAIEDYERQAARSRSLRNELKELRGLARHIPAERETEVLDEDGVPFGRRS